MPRCNNTPPNWSEIFKQKPELEPPGYRETVQSLRENQVDYEREILRKKMQAIHKEKQGAKNKNRSRRKMESPLPNGADSLLNVNKHRGKGR